MGPKIEPHHKCSKNGVFRNYGPIRGMALLVLLVAGVPPAIILILTRRVRQLAVAGVGMPAYPVSAAIR